MTKKSVDKVGNEINKGSIIQFDHMVNIGHGNRREVFEQDGELGVYATPQSDKIWLAEVWASNCTVVGSTIENTEKGENNK